jgi:flagellar basal-body rod protein FlgF
MATGMYVALSAQMALERRLDTIAGNVANLATAGYRAEEVRFEAVMSQTQASSVAFASAGDPYISRQAGPLTRTENQLDVAVQGDGWLAIETPSGTAYTRDGRMVIQATGDLTTLTGRPVLDVGRAPIVLDPNSGPPTIARDGMIMQNGQQLGAIGLFRIDPQAKLARADNAGVIPDRPATEILDFSVNGVVQGFVEGSNVNPILEITRMIAVSRAFDAANSMVDSTDQVAQNAIKTLGETA